jgi:hypothetical protein
MSLLNKVQARLHSKPADNKPAGNAEPEINTLNKLPDNEKIKVLDYLQTVQDLHKDE